MKRILAVIMLAALAWALPARAVTIEKLPLETQAALGANYAVTFTHADLTETTTNTAQSFTTNFAVKADTSVRFVAMKLNEAFDGGSALFTNSTTVIVGDGANDDLYLESTELNADGTEVWYKFAPGNGGTITITPQTTLIYPTGTTNAGPAVMTNATATYTVSVLGQKVYTADDYVDFKFTPGGAPGDGQDLAEMTSGSVTFYLDLQPVK